MTEALDDLDALLETHLLNGRYALDDLIGRGGMASVYRGLDLVLGRTVAIKALNDTAHDPTYPARLRSEARTLAALDHPHLVSLLDASVVDGRTFLVLELVEGGTLRDLVAVSPLTPVKAAVLGHQLADALAHVHAAGVVHRDIKPSNVLMAPGRPQAGRLRGRPADRRSRQHRERHHAGHRGLHLARSRSRAVRPPPPPTSTPWDWCCSRRSPAERAYEGAAVESAMARLHRAPEIPDHLSQGWRNLLRSMTALMPEDRPDARSVARHLARLSDPDRTLRSVLAASPSTPEVQASEAESLRRPGPACGPATPWCRCSPSRCSCSGSCSAPGRRWNLPAPAIPPLPSPSAPSVLVTLSFVPTASVSSADSPVTSTTDREAPVRTDPAGSRT